MLLPVLYLRSGGSGVSDGIVVNPSHRVHVVVSVVFIHHRQSSTQFLPTTLFTGEHS